MAAKDERHFDIPTEDINLPSYGLNLLDGQRAQDMLNKISNGLTYQPKPSTSVAHSNDSLTVIVENANDYEIPTSEFADSMQPMVTLETSDIKEDETNLEPELYIDVKQPYQRFRYVSEKPSKKRYKPSSSIPPDLDLGEDKNVLAEVKLLNYDGVAKIVAYCVTEEGKVHPYNLHGENCNNGVYVLKSKFREGKTTLKMKKVSVTTPKEKEYIENQKRQTAFLSEVGIDNLKFCEHVTDKQIVYVMVTAILEDADGRIISVISRPLLNKKKGDEFKIDDVEPVTAPACGLINNNIKKNRIMMHVTEKTAFPSDVGVKIRERDGSGRVVWEQDLNGKDKITVIKQCVVKFVPPAYRDPKVQHDVEVEVSLYDRVTKIETDPISFVYKGSDSCTLCHTGHQSKKRKLDQMYQEDYMTNASPEFDPQDSCYASCRVLRTISEELPESSTGETNFEEVIDNSDNQIYSVAKGQQVASNSGHASSVGTEEGSVSHQMFKQPSTSRDTVAYPEVAGLDATCAEQNIGTQSLSDLNRTQASMPGPSNASPQFSIAVIQGKPYVVYHDDNTSNQSLQNIGDQQVIVQPLPPQQPSDEMVQPVEPISFIVNNNSTRSVITQGQSQSNQQRIQDGSNTIQQRNQQQQLNQDVLLQILQLLTNQPSQEARNQLIQSLQAGGMTDPSLLGVIQQLNERFFPNNVTSNQDNVGYQGSQVSVDLNDDDLEPDGASDDVIVVGNDDDIHIYPQSMIPTCVEEVTVKTEK
ncbi:Nuclear factor NF-kappa-B p105 subunit [Mactra antiquata]